MSDGGNTPFFEVKQLTQGQIMGWPQTDSSDDRTAGTVSISDDNNMDMLNTHDSDDDS